jgi:protein arginine kinase
MTLDEMMRTPGEWLAGSGPMGDVVVSSRIRLARNIAGYSFLSKAELGERTEIFRRMADEIAASPFGREALVVNMDEASDIDRELLVERHLISRQHAVGEGPRGVTISPTETQAVMINEEDHLRMQGLRCGLQLDNIWDEINALDDLLAQRVPVRVRQQARLLDGLPDERRNGSAGVGDGSFAGRQTH